MSYKILKPYVLSKKTMNHELFSGGKGFSMNRNMNRR